MIYECTDCEHCISYDDGFRIACGHPTLPADEVYKYPPVFYGGYSPSTDRCDGFEEGEPEIEMSADDIDRAVEKYGDDVSSLRKYALEEKTITDDR